MIIPLLPFCEDPGEWCRLFGLHLDGIISLIVASFTGPTVERADGAAFLIVWTRPRSIAWAHRHRVFDFGLPTACSFCSFAHVQGLAAEQSRHQAYRRLH